MSGDGLPVYTVYTRGAQYVDRKGIVGRSHGQPHELLQTGELIT